MATKLWDGTDTGNVGDLSVAANWVPSGVPGNGDDAVFENSTQAVTAGFDQSAVTLATLNVKKTYTGLWGDADNYVKWGATLVRIGEHYGPGSPAGSGRIKLDLGAAASTVLIAGSATSNDSNQAAIRLLCNHANTVVEVRKGGVSIAASAGETSTLSKLVVSFDQNLNRDSDVVVGSGVTLTTGIQNGGNLTLQCAATTLTCEGGNMATEGSGAVTTLNVYGGAVVSNSSGTITAANSSGGSLDFTKSAIARTVTALNVQAGGKVKLDPDVITVTNAVGSNNVLTLTAA